MTRVTRLYFTGRMMKCIRKRGLFIRDGMTADHARAKFRMYIEFSQDFKL